MKDPKIKTYKGIDIFYNPNNGYLYFVFENEEREVKYLFEAQKIIDEPVWEDCNLNGYFVDGVFNDYIGKAKAIKKDVKSGKPYWELQGRYDMGFKKPDSWRETVVYLKSEETDRIYNDWKTQYDKIKEEQNKGQIIISLMVKLVK
jgi:hypothetical protein